MLAVGERVAALELTAPWSVSELRLSRHDRDRLLAWGQLAEWNFRDDFGNYQTKSGEKVRKRSALGLAFLLLARRRSDDLAIPVPCGQRSNAPWVNVSRTCSCFVQTSQSPRCGRQWKLLAGHSVCGTGLRMLVSRSRCEPYGCRPVCCARIYLGSARCCQNLRVFCRWRSSSCWIWRDRMHRHRSRHHGGCYRMFVWAQ